MQARGNAKQQSFNNLVALGGLAVGAGFAFSDRRTKKEIKKVGKLDDGLNVYKFKYKGSDNVQLGVMADEVEKVKPDAVIKLPNTLKMVDYNKVGTVVKLPPRSELRAA